MKKFIRRVISTAVIVAFVLTGSLPALVHAETSQPKVFHDHLMHVKGKVFQAFMKHQISKEQMKTLLNQANVVKKQEKGFYKSNGDKNLTADQKSQLNASLDSIESSI